jgi:hypothetical protein
VTNTATPTFLNGDLGVYPGTSITGFFAIDGGSGIVNGTIHITDAVAQQAQADALTAYNAAKSQAVTQTLTGQDLGGLTLTPGVYFFASSALPMRSSFSRSGARSPPRPARLPRLLLLLIPVQVTACIGRSAAPQLSVHTLSSSEVFSPTRA